MKKQSAKKRLRQLLQHDQALVTKLGLASLAGVDEAGRGPLAGPVVASAVIVRDFSFACVIDDSKKMTPETREVAYREILQKCKVGVSVQDHAVVDDMNIFQAAMRAMEDAVLRLAQDVDCVLVDGNRLPKALKNGVALVDGDALSFSVACASIVAKVTRDRIMHDYSFTYPQYGFDRHKGYCTADHVRALKTHGPCAIHRRSFEPVKSMVEGKHVDLDSLLAKVSPNEE